LDAQGRQALEALLRAHSCTVAEERRARIVLMAAEGNTTKRIAQELGIDADTVSRWRGRIARGGLGAHVQAALADAPRSGRPRSIDGVRRAEIMSIACDPLPDGLGLSGWTLNLLVEDMVLRGMEAPSRSSVHRILTEGDVQPHRYQLWLHSPDPLFRQKVSEICSLYLQPPPGSIVVSFDEKTVHTGEVMADCGPTRTGEDLERHMERVAARWPNLEIHVVLDNLNIHKGERWQRFNERHGGRFHFHYTPLHASWVNQIEMFFGVLARRCLRRKSFRSTEELAAHMMAFVARWNEHDKKPFRWTFDGGFPAQKAATRDAEAA
jgi:transposase